MNNLTLSLKLDDFSGIGPDFLVIGARKAATTWVYKYLSEHPDTRMPPIKEFNYFNTLLSREDTSRIQISERWSKLVHQHSADAQKRSLKCDPLIQVSPEIWYRYQFYNFDGKLSGDVSPLYQDISPSRLKKLSDSLSDLDGLKILYIVREPFSRLMSDINMYLCLSGAKAIEDDELTNILGTRYSRSCDYAKVYADWQSHFGNNVKLLFFEDLRLSPEIFTKELSSFLGITYIPNLHKEIKNPNRSRKVYGSFEFSESQIGLMEGHVRQYMHKFRHEVPQRLMNFYT